MIAVHRQYHFIFSADGSRIACSLWLRPWKQRSSIIKIFGAARSAGLNSLPLHQGASTVRNALSVSAGKRMRVTKESPGRQRRQAAFPPLQCLPVMVKIPDTVKMHPDRYVSILDPKTIENKGSADNKTDTPGILSTKAKNAY